MNLFKEFEEVLKLKDSNAAFLKKVELQTRPEFLNLLISNSEIIAPIMNTLFDQIDNDMNNFFNSTITKEKIKCALIIVFILMIQLILWRLFIRFILINIKKSRETISVLGIDLVQQCDELLKELKKVISK